MVDALTGTPSLPSFSMPDINFAGLLSNTWWWVALVTVVGLFLSVALALLLYYTTYNKRLVFFENVSGQGFQLVKKRRARTLRLGLGGEELLKVFGTREYFTAYGRKMGKNTFWFAKGQDGYWYNFILGDLDAKQAILDVEPIDRDVRLFHVAKDKMNKDTYGKQGFLERYGVHMILFVFLIIMILGLWIITGKLADAMEALSSTAETNAETAKQTSTALNALANIQGSKTSGLVDVDGGG